MSMHGAVNQYTLRPLAYVHGVNAFCCEHMSRCTYCYNVSPISFNVLASKDIYKCQYVYTRSYVHKEYRE